MRLGLILTFSHRNDANEKSASTLLPITSHSKDGEAILVSRERENGRVPNAKICIVFDKFQSRTKIIYIKNNNKN